MWVRHNKGNVFVGNLPADFTDDQLAETFDPFGIVLSAAIARDPATGARLRYGFVDIATEKAANKAIDALNGSEIAGCKLNVKAREKTAQKPGPKHAAGHRPHRPGQRPAPRMPYNGGDMMPRRMPQYAADGAPRPSQYAADRTPRPSQSQMAREVSEAVEPPPRRDFEIVRRPIRRTTTPTFQVERRPLPRRV